MGVTMDTEPKRFAVQIFLPSSPIAARTAKAPLALVHVSSSFPSLARTRETVAVPRFATHTSVPSDLTNSGVVPTVVVPSAPDVDR